MPPKRAPKGLKDKHPRPKLTKKRLPKWGAIVGAMALAFLLGLLLASGVIETRTRVEYVENHVVENVYIHVPENVYENVCITKPVYIGTQSGPMNYFSAFWTVEPPSGLWDCFEPPHDHANDYYTTDEVTFDVHIDNIYLWDGRIIDIPFAFTPSADGVIVENDWGGLVFYTDLDAEERARAFDARVNGELVKKDVTYTLHANDVFTFKITYHGLFTVYCLDVNNPVFPPGVEPPSGWPEQFAGDDYIFDMYPIPDPYPLVFLPSIFNAREPEIG